MILVRNVSSRAKKNLHKRIPEFRRSENLRKNRKERLFAFFSRIYVFGKILIHKGDRITADGFTQVGKRQQEFTEPGTDSEAISTTTSPTVRS